MSEKQSKLKLDEDKERTAIRSPPKKSTSRLRLLPELAIRKSSAFFPTSKDIRALLPWYSPSSAKQY